ncbi:MAG TPA: twin transmembrane helix small protein [Hyphomicrobiaceae bacterium]|nr:twin transmembrane helix small protein [Hyphomicrobiaceae bacterium]
MELTFYHLTTVAAVAVLVVLILGLVNLLRGKSPNLSQKLMRWRVGLQFVAIIIVMIAFYLAH